MLFTIWVLIFASQSRLCLGWADKKCLDNKGKVVQHGERYFPFGSDPCTQCTCTDGKPEMCIAVFCSPPESCRQYHALNDKCCEFVCLDGSIPHIPSIGVNITDEAKTPDSLATTNLGLRLVASAITSFLILALLLFMIHRLRQRRLLLVIRRAGLNGHRLNTAPSGVQRYDDDSNVGYFVGHDQLDFAAYDEPPPPYSFWKPPETYIPTGEAPPPYEMTIRYPPPAIILSPTNQSNQQQQERPFPQPDHIFNTSRSPIGHLQIPFTERRSSSEGRSSTRSQISPGMQSSLDRSDSDFVMESSFHQGIIDSDARYEDVPVSPANNVTVLQLSGNTTNSTPSGLCDDDIANGNNVLLGRSLVDTSCSSLDKNGSKASHSKSSSSSSQESRTGNRCHSYCEGLGQWRAEQTNQKQPLVHSSNNNVFPDPTAWATSESSTTSPSSDQQTMSPSSTDSSPEATNYASSTNGTDGKQDSKECGSCAEKRVLQNHVKEKRNSLERTIKNLKRFSLSNRKKNSTALVNNPKKGIPSKLETGAESNSAFVLDGSCSSESPHSVEDVAPCIHDIRIRCRHYRARPASLNLNSWYLNANQDSKNEKSGGESSSSRQCSTASSADSIPVDNIVITMSNRRSIDDSRTSDSRAAASEPKMISHLASENRTLNGCTGFENRSVNLSQENRSANASQENRSVISGSNHENRLFVHEARSFNAPTALENKAHNQSSAVFENRPVSHVFENRSATNSYSSSGDSSVHGPVPRRVMPRSGSICSETGEHNPRRLSVPVSRVGAYRHGSDSTPEYVKNFNSPTQHIEVENHRLPLENYRRRSSESTNSGT